MDKSDVGQLVSLSTKSVPIKYREICAWETLFESIPLNIQENIHLGIRHAELAAHRQAWKTAAERIARVLENAHDDNHLAGFRCPLQCLSWSVLGHTYSHAEKSINLLLKNLTFMNSSNAMWALRTVSPFQHTYDISEILAACRSNLLSDECSLNFLNCICSDSQLMSEVRKSAKLISLGNGCFGWIRANEMGMRSRITDCTNALPFNMAEWSLTGAIQAIREDFSGLSVQKKFRKIFLQNETPLAFHTDYKIIFNHETDDEFLDNDFHGLRFRYQEFVRQFEQTWQGNRVYLFINWRAEDPLALEGLLHEMSRDAKYRLLIIETATTGPTKRPILKSTKLVHIPRPRPDFFWARDPWSPENLQFELYVRQAIKEVMIEVAEL